MAPRILLLSYYFAPDFSAGAFRMEALVRALAARLGPTARIDVVTCQPNRYGGAYAQVGFEDASLGESVRVHRVDARPPLRVQGAQLLSFGRFARAAGRLARELRPDLIIASSSRLGTGWLGARLARELGVPFHLDLRDLFPDSVKHLLPGRAAALVHPWLQRLQGFTVRQAQSVSVTSPMYAEYLAHAYRHPRLLFVPNGIDPLFLEHDFTAVAPARPGRVLYAGNIGLGQALHHILPELAARTRGRFVWRVLGAGGGLQPLRQALRERGVDNVELLPPVPREQLLEHYEWADTLFLHLSPGRAMRRVIPSKIFEYGASRRRILAGASGHARRFMLDFVPNVTCFEPGDVEAALTALERPATAVLDPLAFRQRFARGGLMTELAGFIVRDAPTRESALELPAAAL